MKTIEGQFSDNPENSKKDKRLVLSTQRGILKEDIIKAKRVFFKEKAADNSRQFHKAVEDDNFIFNGSEIMICDKRGRNENREL